MSDRRPRRHPALVVITTAAAVITVGCSAAPAPNAHVTSAQRTALSRYYLAKLWIPDGFTKIECPVDVLGAAHIGHRLRVYTVVHCDSASQHSASQHCAMGTEYTEGLVTDLIGTSIVRIERDDSPSEDGVIAESNIYPPSLRSRALRYINYDGPAWLRDLARKALGCPHSAH